MVIPVSIPLCDKVAPLRERLECMTSGICTSFPAQYNVDLLAEPLRDGACVLARYSTKMA